MLSYDWLENKVKEDIRKRASAREAERRRWIADAIAEHQILMEEANAEHQRRMEDARAEHQLRLDEARDEARAEGRIEGMTAGLAVGIAEGRRLEREEQQMRMSNSTENTDGE